MLLLVRIVTWGSLLLLIVSTISAVVSAGDAPPEEVGDTSNGEEAQLLRNSDPYSADAGADDAGTLPATPDAPTRETDTDIATPAVLDDSENKSVSIPWRKDPSVLRHPGSYLGGGVGYVMGHAWYTYEQRDFVRSYALGPMHASATYIRVGDAFFEWLAVGFQVDLISGGFGKSPEKTSGFGLFLDTTLYPVKGFGIRPSIGFGFSYAQAGPEAYKFGFGGPLHLAFSMSYEFRLTRLLTMGPLVQISWVRGDEYDAMYLTIGIEVLKWFLTPEG